MANSLSQYPLGVNPFERAILTPGPLGHNDAASPDSTSLLGDTPGPLGINDHADPLVAAKAKEDSRKMVASSLKAGMRPSLMSISQDGLDFIWAEEYREGISERLHWPRGASGVTLGAGYDMKARSKDAVTADLIMIGINADDAKKAAEGAGLGGKDADSFVRNNRKLIVIDNGQATKLLKLIITGYEAMVRRGVKVPLLQHEFDALVSFAYNPGGRFGTVIKLINEGLITEAMEKVKAANTSGGHVLAGLVTRRRHEVNLYLKGVYTE